MLGYGTSVGQFPKGWSEAVKYSTTNHVHYEPPAWPALLCAAIAAGGAWLAGYGWFALVLLGLGGWVGWTIFQWMDMTTGRLMRIEQKLNDSERDESSADISR